MAKSRLIADRAVVVDGPVSMFDSCPGMSLPLCGDRWVACGPAAIAFDPICGDGTAQAVREAILAGLDGRLRKYPDPVGTAFRQAVARRHGVEVDRVLAGNGSDDLLTILTRTFVSPGDVVVYPSPSYILYRTLAELQDARRIEIPFREDWTLDPGAYSNAQPRLAFLANPNSPSGTGRLRRSTVSPSRSTARRRRRDRRRRRGSACG